MAKILAIDDKNDNLISLKAILKDVFPKTEVFTALNGQQGIELATIEDPDLIMLDIVMPGMDGFDVCRRLKLDPLLREIPVVFLTSLKESKENRLLALEVGAEAFLSKPIDVTELTAQVGVMLKIRAANIAKRDENIRLQALVKTRTEALEKELEERKRAEKVLKESEEVFSHFLENSPIYIFFKDKNIRAIRLSKNYEQMIGKPLNEILGKTMDELFPSDIAKKMIADDQKILTEGKLIVVDEEFNGRYYTTIKFPIIIDGDPLYLAGYTIDITERKHAEQAMRESEAKFKYVFESANVGKSITLPTGKINVNKAFCDMLGYSQEELSNKTWQELTPPDEIEFLEGKISPLLKGDEDSARFEKRYIHKNGSYVWTDVSVSIRRDNERKPLHFITTVVDITERKKAEMELEVQMNEMEKFNNAMVGRENKMIALKREINELLSKLNLPNKYSSPNEIEKDYLQ